MKSDNNVNYSAATARMRLGLDATRAQRPPVLCFWSIKVNTAGCV